MIKLDRPAYHSMLTCHKHLMAKNGKALAYNPQFAAFAALEDESQQAFEDLQKLEIGASGFWLLETKKIEPNAGFNAEYAHCVQMVFDREIEQTHEFAIENLSQNDAKAIYDLAILTKPGPFFARTNEMAQFIGIKENGNLIAMMGERLAFDNYAETSALGTRPEYQGRGMGRFLFLEMTQRVLKRGQIPFLHVYKWNEKAIKMYEDLGYKQRTDIFVSILKP